MERDLRETPLYQEIEAAYRRLAEPGFGQITARERRARESGRQNGRVLRRADGCARGASERPHLPRGGGRLRDAPGHARPQRGLRAALVARRLDPVLPLRSQRRPAPRSSSRSSPERSARRGSSPRCPGIVEHHEWSPDGTRILLLVAGHGAEQTDALGSGTLGHQAELPSWIPLVDSTEGAGERAPRALHPGGRERRAPAGLARSRQRLGGGLVRGREHRRHRLRGRRRGCVVPRRARADRPRARTSRTLRHTRRAARLDRGSPDGTCAAVVEAVCSDRVIVAGRRAADRPRLG